MPTDHSAPLSSANMARIGNDLFRRALILQTQRDANQKQIDEIDKEVGIAKARLSKKESIDGVLDEVERRFHQKSIGVLESLLSAFLNDVLPREVETVEKDIPEQSVKLTLETKRNITSLDISVCSGEEEEDAMRGRGGSVANVLSAGLRLITMARSGPEFRPFLVLDEADCWIRGDRLVSFSQELHQLSKELGIQMLYISHHDQSDLMGFPVELQRTMDEDGYLSVSVTHAPVHEKYFQKATANRDALIGLRLENVMSHKDSYIPLTAGITLISGKNDVGKSAVAESLRAISYNSGADSLIRHGAHFMRVTMVFVDTENKKKFLQWERLRKGAPKVVYRLLDENDVVIRETPSAKDVPEWASKMLGIAKRDDLDVQICDQKRPVFLLDETPARRAAMLDIGRESQHLRDIRDKWKSTVESDRKTIRDGEKKLKTLLVIRLALRSVDALLQSINVVRDDLDNVDKNKAKIESSELDYNKAVRAYTLSEFAKTIPEELFLGITSWKHSEWIESLQKQRFLEKTAVLVDKMSAVRMVGEKVKELENTSIAWPDRAKFSTLDHYDNLVKKAENVVEKRKLRTAVAALETVPSVDQQRIFTVGANWKGTERAVMFLKNKMPAINYLRKVLPELQQEYTEVTKTIESLKPQVNTVGDNFSQWKRMALLAKENAVADKGLQDATQELDHLNETEHQYLKEWGKCPFCGALHT